MCALPHYRISLDPMIALIGHNIQVLVLHFQELLCAYCHIQRLLNGPPPPEVQSKCMKHYFDTASLTPDACPRLATLRIECPLRQYVHDYERNRQELFLLN